MSAPRHLLAVDLGTGVARVGHLAYRTADNDSANQRLQGELFAQFLEVYKRMKPVYKKLNGEIRSHV